MKVQSHFKKIVAVFVLLSLAMTISGCVSKDRYKNVDALITAIEPSTTGKIFYEERDKGTGFTSPSTIVYRIKGESTFEILVERIQAVEGIECNEGQNSLEVRRIECRKGVVTVEAIENTENGVLYTFLSIKDALNGDNS